uniref:Centrosomal protein 112 n=1 Tax=Sphaeramia orbicularis TaxID=375764 RepID=A0A673C8B2_9TELE
MSKHEDSWERLDKEFDHCLLDMKPYVLKHPNKTERQRCAIWIKKFCDPASWGSGLLGRRNRNLYARLLLHMLKRGDLEGPFNTKPEPGTLKTLPTYMVMTNLQLLQVEELFRIKVLEAKHQEEKLKMQQRHDADVEKILDRKNGEIEEVKSLYRAKQKESEELIRKLERKVQSVLRESQVICESKEKQIAELKKMSDQSADSLKNEWEKKRHAAVAKIEQEKFELQKKHTENIQELLEDTNLRLAKMEAEYNARSQATEQTVRELEFRVKQQSVEVEKGNTLRQKVTQEKAHLEIHIASISAELQEANRRNTMLQKEKEEQSEHYEQTLQKLHAKHETDLSHFQQEHTLSTAKASELIEELEKTVAQLRQQIQDSEHQRQKQVRRLIIFSRLLQVCFCGSILISACVLGYRDVESQLDRARETQRQQIQQADIALEQFKKQVELSSEKAYTDMKLQMEKVEEDLIRSKSLRENQAKEFSQQLDALRQKYEQQMAEQRMQHEQERTRLQQQHSAEKDSLVQERQREVNSLERQARAALQQHQQHTQEWRKRDAQIISDLEAQLTNLNEELQGAHVQHKQQLAEMALLWEEEKQKAFLDKEASLDRLCSDMERIRSDLEGSYQQERDAAQEKTNSRLKQIEKEYSQKLTKSAQVISFLIHLFSPLSFSIPFFPPTELLERTSTDGGGKEALQEKVESLQRQLHSSEKKLLSKELETEEKVTLVRKEYEEKIKGLMPAELRQELEDTIASLKAQVRASLCLWRHLTTFHWGFVYTPPVRSAK